MRELTLKLMLAVAVFAFGFITARAEKLRSVEVSAPANRRVAQAENEIVIDHFHPTPCVERGTEVNIYGAGFGPRQAGRYVVLGGHGISAVLRVTAWREGRITALIQNNRRIEQGQWYYIGVQNEDHQWISNISRTINICRALE